MELRRLGGPKPTTLGIRPPNYCHDLSLHRGDYSRLYTDENWDKRLKIQSCGNDKARRDVCYFLVILVMVLVG